MVSPHFEDLPNSKTSEALAESLGVGKATVERDGQLAIALNTLSELDPSFKSDVLNGSITLTKKEVMDLAL